MLGIGRGTGSSARRIGPAAVVLLASAALVAACAQRGAAPTNPPVATNPPATVAPATNPPASTAAGLALSVRTDAAYGAVVAGKDGLSLYVFLNDKGDGTSACTGGCAGSWPPLTVASASDVPAGSGISGALGTITRADGSIQVTLGGAPLYYFAGDSAAGDTKGQGLADVWYLASPSGVPAKGGGAAATPASSKCGGPACY